MERWMLSAIGLAALFGCQACMSLPQERSSDQPEAELAGGWTDQGTDAAPVEEAADQAQGLLREWLKDPTLAVERVLRAQSQVVAGTNFRLALEVQRKGAPVGVVVVVYQDLKGTFSLTSVAIGPTGGSSLDFSSAPGASDLYGGFTEQSTTNPGMQEAARKALELMRQPEFFDDPTLELTSLSRVLTGVCAGIDYYFEMELETSAGSLSAQAELYQDLKDDYVLTWARLERVR